ncbi:MAG TPA: outer membrane beta-barrel protein, partial [Candidatus Methylomirabilis sp.]|nr:outer membrane beta-barrel protein [Candidatus Methylomirabilis sp.]
MAGRKLPMAMISILLFLLLFATQGIAVAEGFLDLYGTPSMNATADVRVSETRTSGTTSAAASIDLSSSKEFGARFGAWFPPYNWVGLAMDVGYLQAEGPGVDITALPLSLLFALRAPLFGTPDLPGGRLQPYAMAGVTFYKLDISVQLDGMGGSSTNWSWPGVTNSDDKVIGPYLSAGVAWQPARNLAVFGEYRYSTFDVGYDTTDSWIFPSMRGRVDATVDSSRLLFGISYRFGEKITGP